MGPMLWNIYYDDVLRMDILVGYADDLGILATSKDRNELELKTEYTLHDVWMDDQKTTEARLTQGGGSLTSRR